MDSQFTNDKNLSSLLKSYQFKIETSTSSFASSYRNSSKKSSSKNSFNIANTIDYNYVNNQGSLLKEANALLKKPLTKQSNLKSDKNKNDLIDLNDYDDPVISVKLNINNINPVLDDEEKTAENNKKLDNSLEKQITRKMFSNIIKDYDMVGIAPDLNFKITPKLDSSSEETINNDNDENENNKKTVAFELNSAKTKGLLKK